MTHSDKEKKLSSHIDTMPGKLFFMEELAGPLCPDTN